MADYTVKQHDLDPPFEVTLKDKNGPVDLTGATSVMLHFATASGSTEFSGECEITDAEAGIVRYLWEESDVATVNTYNIEWEVTWASGRPTTFPTKGYKTVEVAPDLA
jgi:hypothetical protein